MNILNLLTKIDDFLIDEVAQKVVDYCGYCKMGIMDVIGFLLTIGFLIMVVPTLLFLPLIHAFPGMLIPVVFSRYFYERLDFIYTMHGKYAKSRNSARFLLDVKLMKIPLLYAIIFEGTISFIPLFLAYYVVCCDTYKGHTISDTSRRWARA